LKSHRADRRRSDGTIDAAMRKWCLSIALSVLLLLAQQGAMLHEIWHLKGELNAASQTPPAASQHKAADKLCEICLAYSAMAAFARPAVMPLVLAAVRQAPPTAADVASLAAEAPAQRSRGPPLSL
jgi:hypothetical protein